MKDVILLLCLQDEVYGQRLLGYLVGKKNPALHPELLTIGEAVSAGENDQRENVVVLTDQRELQKNSRHRVILLSGVREEDGDSIYLYQKAEGIYRELIRKLGGGQKKETQKHENGFDGGRGNNNREGIYFLFSPQGGISAFAVSLTQYLGQAGRSLYLNLTGFPLYYGCELTEDPAFDGEGLAQMLFSVGQESFAEKAKKLSKPFGSAFMMAPVPHFKDLLDSRFEDWKRLFERLRKECGYANIVVEAGQLFESTLDVMELCEYPCFITNDRIMGRIQRRVFESYLRLEQKEILQRRCIFTENPVPAEQAVQILNIGALYETGEDPVLMNAMEQWVTQLERREADDCVIEYDE